MEINYRICSTCDNCSEEFELSKECEGCVGAIKWNPSPELIAYAKAHVELAEEKLFEWLEEESFLTDDSLHIADRYDDYKFENKK